jgi:hypothetical protein
MPQWSLRTLFIATAIVPVAIFVIAKSTPFYISTVVTIAIAAWIAVAIVAWVGDGSRRAWARGTILSATAYGLLIAWMGTELDLFGSKLATSGVLFYAHDVLTKPIDSEVSVPEGGTVLLGGIQRLNPFPNPFLSIDLDNVDLESQEENLGLRASTSDGETIPPPSNPGPDPSYPFIIGLPDFSFIRFPDRRNFAIIGHIYWAAIIGVAGGCFAQWLVQHEQPEVAKRTSNSTVE